MNRKKAEFIVAPDKLHAITRACPSCKRKRVTFMRRPYRGDYLAWCRCGLQLILGYNGRVRIDRTVPRYCQCVKRDPDNPPRTIRGNRCGVCGKQRKAARQSEER